MLDASQGLHGTYRCPVCGHRDLAFVERGRERALVACSYCETWLEVSPRGQDSFRLSVQVAEKHASR